MTKRTIIIGATSGIGRALADVFLREGYTVGLVGRRLRLLDEVKTAYPGRVFVKQIDVALTDEAMEYLSGLIAEMGGADIIVISSGIGFINRKLHWSPEKETIDVNVSGFAAMANVAMRHFLSQKAGHLVSISSIAALRGDDNATAYSASKAFISNYMQGLRKKVSKLKIPITITDIQPGFVDTAMAQGKGLFWVAAPQKAAEQIYSAIKNKKSHAYVTKRWRIIAWFMKTVPDFIYHKT
jgi:short-subunit dehydrogenase